MPLTRSAHDMQNAQHAILCLSTDRASSAEIDGKLQIASEAGFSCIELWAPALETYLASHPVVWLDLQMRQCGIHRLIVNGLAPLSIVRGTRDEDALVSQARFLELCTHLDALGGAILVLHPDPFTDNCFKGRFLFFNICHVFKPGSPSLFGISLQQSAVIFDVCPAMEHEAHKLFCIHEIGGHIPFVHEGGTAPFYCLFHTVICTQDDLPDALDLCS